MVLRDREPEPSRPPPHGRARDIPILLRDRVQMIQVRHQSSVTRPSAAYADMLRNAQNKNPASMIEIGSVSTHAIRRFRTVAHCRPERFAAIVPAMPDESTCVVLTGSPNPSAAPIVAIAVISAAAPWA